MTKEIHNVSSENQSGGITSHTVNQNDSRSNKGRWITLSVIATILAIVYYIRELFFT